MFVFWPYGPISRVTTPQSLQYTHTYFWISPVCAWVCACVCIDLAEPPKRRPLLGVAACTVLAVQACSRACPVRRPGSLPSQCRKSSSWTLTCAANEPFVAADGTRGQAPSGATCWSDQGVVDTLHCYWCCRKAVVYLCFSGFVITGYSALLHREICRILVKRFMSTGVLQVNKIYICRSQERCWFCHNW